MCRRNCLMIVMLFLCGLCSLCSLPPLLAQELPPDTGAWDGITHTVTLTVCKDGDNYRFGYETNEDFLAGGSGLVNVDNAYHWGVTYGFFSDPDKRSTFDIPASAMTWETPTEDVLFVNHPMWWIQRFTGEVEAVQVDETTLNCDGTEAPTIDVSNRLIVGQRVEGWYDGEDRLGTIVARLDPDEFTPPLDFVTEGYWVHYDEMDEGASVMQSRSQITVV